MAYYMGEVSSARHLGCQPSAKDKYGFLVLGGALMQRKLFR